MRTLWLSFGFVLTLIAGDLLVGEGLMHLHGQLRTGKSGGEVRCALEQSDVDVVVLGTSRARHHIDTTAMSEVLDLRALNLGENGQGILYAHMVLGMMLERGIRPGLVLVQVEPRDLVDPMPGRAVALAPFARESQTVYETLAASDPWARVKLLSRTYRFNHSAISVLKHSLSPPSMGVDYSGYEPLRGTFNGEVSQTDTAARFEPDPLSVWIHGQLIDAARAAGARVVLFEGPRLRRGRSGWDEQASAQFEALARDHGATFVRWDEESFPDLARQELWRDVAHLNGAGAELFTAHILATELMRDFREVRR
jgi:hypothetical protein